METRLQQWTQDNNNGPRQQQFLRQSIADKRPWTHLTQDIWDTDSKEKTIGKKKWTQDNKTKQ